VAPVQVQPALNLTHLFPDSSVALVVLEQIARCPPRRTDSPMVFCIHAPFLFAMQARNDSGTSPGAFEGGPINVFYVYHTTRKLGFKNDVGIDGTAE